MKVSIAVESHLYGQMTENAIQELRPHLEVVVVEPEDLVPQVERQQPEMLISHLRGSEMPTEAVGAWVELSVEPDRPSVACVDGHLEEFTDLDLDGLLSLVDEAEEHAEGGRDPG